LPARKDAEASKKGAKKKRLAYLEAHIAELRGFISDFEAWVAPHDAWTRMTDADRERLHALMSRVAPSTSPEIGLAEYYKHKNIRMSQVTLLDACDATLRAAVRGEERIYQLLPQALKEMIDRTYRLPDRFFCHQIFGEGVSRQVAREEHPHDHMLLQLLPDHMMMGAWDGGGVVQFRISPEDLRLKNWDAAAVTMESD